MLKLIEESGDIRIQLSAQVVTRYFLCRFHVLHIVFFMQAHSLHIVCITYSFRLCFCLTNSSFTSFHSARPSNLMCFVIPVLLCLSLRRMVNLPSRLLSAEGTQTWSRSSFNCTETLTWRVRQTSTICELSWTRCYNIDIVMDCFMIDCIYIILL